MSLRKFRFHVLQPDEIHLISNKILREMNHLKQFIPFICLCNIWKSSLCCYIKSARARARNKPYGPEPLKLKKVY